METHSGEQAVKNRSRKFLITLVVMLSAAVAQAQPKPIRSGEGFAFYPQVMAEDWAKLVDRGNLAAGKLVQPGASPNATLFVTITLFSEIHKSLR